MTDKEAMKLALDALEANQPINYCMNNNGEKFPMFSNDPLRQERNEKAITALKERLAQPEQEPVAVYGYCPECGAKGVQRERRPNGNDKCAKGHTYPSSKATTAPQSAEQNFCSRCGKRTADLTHIHTCTPPREGT
jgi:ssDNA-binding Zn-finger/Zn-ribbon topoisomerase 1